jgi:hypothetical protein
MKRPSALHPAESRSQSGTKPGSEHADEQDDQVSDAVDNPWIELAGIFADDPTLMPMLDEIYAAREADRKALDAEQ